MTLPIEFWGYIILCELIFQNHEKIGKLDEERTHLRADYSELCSKIEAGEGAKAAVEGLQKENTTLKSDLDNLRLQNTELNKKHHDLSLKLERSAKDNKSLQGSLDSKSEEVKTLRNQMNLALSEKVSHVQANESSTFQETILPKFHGHIVLLFIHRKKN